LVGDLGYATAAVGEVVCLNIIITTGAGCGGGGGGEGLVSEGQASKGCFFLLYFWCFCCNSYVERSIDVCMYVGSNKIGLTP
jgi:hypothetical protein